MLIALLITRGLQIPVNEIVDLPKWKSVLKVDFNVRLHAKVKQGKPSNAPPDVNPHASRFTLHASRFTLHAFCFKRHMGDRMNITIHKYANSYHCNINQKKLILTMTSFSLLTSVCAERKLLTAFNRETLRILDV